ncbi:NAD(P)/FAD-dependent oxidoreductase [Hydrogenobacter sp. T-2]|uniref:phytoene desaturase family protein n=1 Tax=Pampinifervens diazotrophicum TaxID=1632018 RepID=UPI002B26062E|nr:NAD(P)/FAD-dependent oxidoreductase [Hydrogenobacter sp. T-2]WPM32136.1 NAD(P)/FAD-dependent oxidoreductase [Hydrogenobacter sp. T-2]
MLDYAVVGGGIGGVLASSLLSHMGKDVILFEALDYLGGCAGTFQRKGFYYNVGAATFVGAEEELPVGKIAKYVGLELPIKPIDPAMVIYLGDKTIRRWKNRELALEEISKAFPGLNHRAFWKRVYEVSDAMWSMWCDSLPYPSLTLPFRNLSKHPVGFLSTLLCNFFSAKRVVKVYLGDFNSDYELFLTHHTLITAQGFLEEVPFSVASLGLTYPNLTNYYVIGGMGKLLDTFAQRVKHVSMKTRVKAIRKKPWGFLIETNKGQYEAKRVILNTTLWKAGDLIEELKDFSERAKRRYSKLWGAFTIYMTVEGELPKDFSHHHFILLREPIPYTGSRSLFLSISEEDDPVLSKEKTRSITISTHTRLELWEGLSKEEYEERKERATEYCLELIYKHLPELRALKKLHVFAGTPKTFERYTGRYRGSVGGIPVIKENFPFSYPSSLTPVEGVYLVGDTVFPGQGWPGVSMGVINLLKLIERDFQIC